MYRFPIDLDSYIELPNVISTAIYDASRGKKSRIEVIEVLNNIDYYVYIIKEMIHSNSFKASPYRKKIIVDRGKERELTIPEFFPDQIIHHILIQAMEYWMMKIIDPYTASSVPGRGRFFVIDKIRNFMHFNPDAKYCIKSDIRRCYPSITANIAFNALCQYFKGIKFLNFIYEVIFASPESLALGNYTSAWLINLILLPMDRLIRGTHYTKRDKLMKTVWFYTRYMDDFVYFGSNKAKLKHLDYLVQDNLNALGLELKYHNLIDIYAQPVDMVGYKFRNYYDENGIHKVSVGIRKATFIKFVELCKLITSGNYDQSDALSFLSSLGNIMHHNYDTLLYNHLYKYGVTLDQIKAVAYERDCPSINE